MDFNEESIKNQLDCYKENNCIEDLYAKLFAKIILKGWFKLNILRDVILEHSVSVEDCILKLMNITHKFAIIYSRDETNSMRPHEYLIKIRDSGELTSEMKTVCKIQ